MMMKRRTFSLLAVAALVAGCMQTQEVDSNVASTLFVQEVVATTSVTRKNTALPKQQILNTVEAKSLAVLQAANPKGYRPVKVNVNIDNFYIANPGAGALLGSTMSTVHTTVEVVDLETNSTIKDGLSVIGSTEARPTIFGAAAIQEAAKEVDIIASDLAQNLKIAIYGE
ncbi:hypothetical protein J7382_18035 [Shimia sp. R11_0]|uniref:hypothetical protein n=1 Tax=Shimia sp. R11_0 TaxID=2821096 RepID=UPI001ADB4A03|nr:hypothetical protein [Shimia sp. R11_0]MBO9479449.1 hypothetical protein [Shimia sp. R11_0]